MGKPDKGWGWGVLVGDDSHTQPISGTNLSDYRLTAIYETITKVLIEPISKLLGADKEFVKENLKKTFKSRYHFYTKIYFWEILLNCCVVWSSEVAIEGVI